MASMQIPWSCLQVKYQGSCIRRHPHVIKSNRINNKTCSSRVKLKVEGTSSVDDKGSNRRKKVRVLIAGGGIGGLVLALAAKNRGHEVKVFEKNLSAVRGEGRHRGPIQLMSSALAVLEAIDESVASKVMEAGCVIVGSNILRNNSKVVDFIEEPGKGKRRVTKKGADPGGQLPEKSLAVVEGGWQ
ncbi:hypothetical protein PIB30_031715 [Stylosanthes scabra]|uniref:Zeaxanthin epoxidase n=1 Tax=Stylosanthes scabra TaxID=79078 RepID=A0ABU6SCS6_9FABA|nr:hypothetical protein [Stylosanthes scabra]